MPAYVAVTAANRHRATVRHDARREHREFRVAHGQRKVSANAARPGVRRPAGDYYEFANDVDNRQVIEHTLRSIPALPLICSPGHRASGPRGSHRWFASRRLVLGT
jgi:hypothetical protein